MRARLALTLGTLFCGSSFAAGLLQGSEWRPLQIGDTALPADTGAFVQFHSKGRLRGFSGCNHLMADYEASDGHIFIGPVAATRMACPEPAMTHEAALAAALENARTYRRDGIRLVLFDPQGQPGLELRQIDWD